MFARIIAIFLHQTAEAPCNCGPRDCAIVAIQSPEAKSNDAEGSWKNSTIADRSNRDGGAIELRSLHLQHGIRVASLLIDLTGVVEASMPRSTPDRGPIVARSWPDRGEKRGPIVVVLEAKLKPSHRGIQATSHAYGIAPSTPRNRFHNRANYPRSSDPFSF